MPAHFCGIRVHVAGINCYDWSGMGGKKKWLGESVFPFMQWAHERTMAKEGPLEDRAAAKREKILFLKMTLGPTGKNQRGTIGPVDRPKMLVQLWRKLICHSSTPNNPLFPPVGFNQLLQGVPGLLVSNLEEMEPHLATVSKNKHSVGAAGVLFLGANLSNFSLCSSVSLESCVVPGWIGQRPSAIQAVLLNCVMKKSQ